MKTRAVCYTGAGCWGAAIPNRFRHDRIHTLTLTHTRFPLSCVLVCVLQHARVHGARGVRRVL